MYYNSSILFSFTSISHTEEHIIGKLVCYLVSSGAITNVNKIS